MPAIVAVTMGYGHLRAALPLADALGGEVLSMDRPPFSGPEDVRRWDGLRLRYEKLSRHAGLPVIGPVDRALLAWITAIPRLAPPDTRARPTWPVRYLATLASRGFGAGLVDHLRARGAPLLTTFYAPAVLADAAGLADVVCVVTDADVNRVWAAPDPARARIRYAVPTARAAHRLRSFGVPAACIHRTGFPLPLEVTPSRDDPAARRRLAARLRRLDPAGAAAADAPAEARALAADADPADVSRPLEVAFAVGGAGAQTEIAAALVGALAPRLRAGTLRLTLVAGTRPEVAERLDALATARGLRPGPDGPVDLLFEPAFDAYARRFHRRLAELDLLLTKPSELTFFGTAGFALGFTTPLGAQEHANRAWARRHGAAVDVGPPRRAAGWLDAMLASGALARAAFGGWSRLPRDGTRRVLALLPTPAPVKTA